MSYILQDAYFQKGRYSCIFSSIRSILARQIKDIDETSVYFLCNGMNFDYSGDIRSVVWYRTGENLVRHLMDSQYAKVKYYSILDPDFFLKESYKAICDNNMVLLFVDSTMLDYHPVFKHSLNKLHVIVLYGIDILNDVAYIGDSFFIDDLVQVLTYQGPTSLKKLKYGIKEFAIIEAPDINTLGAADLFSSVANNINNFFHCSDDNQGYFKGNKALKQYIKDFEQLYEIDEDTYCKSCSNIYLSFRLGSVIPMLNYFISLTADYSELQQGNYLILLDELQRLNAGWNKAALGATKAGLVNNRDKLRSIVKDVNLLLERQDRVLYDILMNIKSVNKK